MDDSFDNWLEAEFSEAIPPADSIPAVPSTARYRAVRTARARRRGLIGALATPAAGKLLLAGVVLAVAGAAGAEVTGHGPVPLGPVRSVQPGESQPEPGAVTSPPGGAHGGAFQSVRPGSRSEPSGRRGASGEPEPEGSSGGSGTDGGELGASPEPQPTASPSSDGDHGGGSSPSPSSGDGDSTPSPAPSDTSGSRDTSGGGDTGSSPSPSSSPSS